MTSKSAELMAGIAGAVTFLGTLLALAFPWWICLLLTGLVYVGVNLYLGGLFEDKVEEIMSGAERALSQMRDRINQDRRTVRELRDLSASIDDPQIQRTLTDICDIAEKIFLNFEQDREDMKRAHRFLSQFQRLLPIVENFAHLSSDPDRKAVLTDADQANMKTTLDVFLSNLKDAYQAFQENNLMKLRMSTGVLKKMIELDESVQRKERSGG